LTVPITVIYLERNVNQHRRKKNGKGSKNL